MPMILRENDLVLPEHSDNIEIAVDNQDGLIRMASSWRGVEQLGSSSGS